MHLKQISLVNYKNFDSQNFDFDLKFNAFVGKNGKGKTNALDAIYHLCFGKSYFNPVTSQNIRHGEDFFMLEGRFHKEGKEERILCSVRKGSKKLIKRNGKAYERFSDHIGLLPLVIISPADRDLIIEGSETRRKFMDGVIAQSDKTYLQALINYNKVLMQRNSLLKYFAANHTFDTTTLEVYNEQLSEYGDLIHARRKDFIESFTPIFREQYCVISGSEETIGLSYESQLDKSNFRELFEARLEKDRALQYTSGGTHKDDLKFTIADHPIKKFGSQGQQKTYLIALKFAQFHFLKEQAGTTPILLLDDIFDKLDESRVEHIVSLVDQETFGQIFLSDTHKERTESIVRSIHQSYKIFSL